MTDSLSEKMKEKPVFGNYYKDWFEIQCFQYWNTNRIRDVLVDVMVRDAFNYKKRFNIILIFHEGADVKYSKTSFNALKTIFDRAYGVGKQVIFVMPEEAGAKLMDTIAQNINPHVYNDITYRVVLTIEEAKELGGIDATDND